MIPGAARLASDPASHVLLVLGAGCGALGLVFALIGAGLLASERRFGRCADPAEGTVTRLRMAGAGGRGGSSRRYVDGVSYLATVRFTTRDGREIEAESKLGSNPAPGRPGDIVKLRYDRHRPERFRLHRASRLGGCVAICLLLAGVLFLATGIGLAQAA